ncbi:hypothetical protein F895_02931 [Acinetobacter sp. CIP 64.2]|nr:hypothetical protein F895_02931 [Acinetobacter sp. CIP 64.2]
MGIHDVNFVYAEGLDMPALRTDALKAAQQKAQQVAI